MSSHTILLHKNAPEKPAYGAPCNRCGVCCAAALCPVGIVFFRKKQGACPALLWQSEARIYACGLVVHLPQFLPRLRAYPRLTACLAALIKKRIAAGKGCDSSALLEANAL